MTRGIDLEGEFRDATVLFVDLVGSAAATSTRSPAAVVAVANRLFGEVVRTVTECDGWVNRFQGDAGLDALPEPSRPRTGWQPAGDLELRGFAERVPVSTLAAPVS